MDVLIYDPWRSQLLGLLGAGLVLLACALFVGYGIYLLFTRNKK